MNEYNLDLEFEREKKHLFRIMIPLLIVILTKQNDSEPRLLPLV